jgi:hypothetical protein
MIKIYLVDLADRCARAGCILLAHAISTTHKKID